MAIAGIIADLLPATGLSSTILTTFSPAAPVLCLIAPARPAESLDRRLSDVPPETSVFQAPAGASAVAALRACANAHPGRDVVLLGSDASLPPSWWSRLCAAQKQSFDVISPLSNAIATHDPFIDLDRPDSVADADACVWMLGENELIPVRHWLSVCCLWRAEAIASLPPKLADGELAPGQQAALLDSLYATAVSPATHKTLATALTPAAVAVLRKRIAALRGRIPLAAGRDDKPVLLHVLHGWGGGVQHFVETLMASSRGFRHLALVAHGSSERHLPGERLDLYDRLEADPIATWPLALGIGSTALASNDYEAVLNWIQHRFRVGQVLVSSLIGHGLAALRTGLPTAVVCHDYYPLWPCLHEDFGDNARDFSASALDGALSDIGPDFPFAESRPAAWRQLREDYVEALLAAQTPMFCPSRTVQHNIERIEPRLATLPWLHIPHGLAAWSSEIKPTIPPARDGLRVLVLGRINGGKGEDLLARLIPLLDPRIELVLLGAGRAGMKFFGQSGVHVRMDYQRDALPTLINQIAPDLALIPVTVAETFSYTLSELWSLGVPVLATRIGSLAERISDGENGLLTALDPAVIAAKLAELLAEPKPLLGLRVIQHQATPDRMALAYEAVLTATQAGSFAGPYENNSIGRGIRHQLELAQAHSETTLSRALARISSQQVELERRGDWGDALQDQLDERVRWAKSLEKDLGAARIHVERLSVELDERSQWALALQDEITGLKQDLTDLRELHAQQQTEIESINNSLQSAVAHGDSMQRDRDSILASRSWRLTRPLRHANRLFSQLLSRLKFRWQRLGSLGRRTRASLHNRGINGTAARIRDELRPGKSLKSAPLPVPATLPDAAGIVLPNSATPVASIVIPVYNHLDATLICLRSLAQTKNRTPHEIIIVDDCSSDESSTALPDIPGLHYQRNLENLGFIGACNAGAANARGQFVVFLNNDTAVQDGWLDALLDTFNQHRDVGLVGAKLVYPDGRLQEAGGIVFSDGSGWNYGRFDDPADPRYNFVREVDYCSGAAIALRTDLFRQFGGFDSHYAPAYYEDTDLAMKVRQAGLRVLYQPASVVVHFEGISSGTDTSTGTKRYQVINQEKFLTRWKEALASHPAAGTDIVIARQHRTKQRVLVIDATTPQPDHDSGSVRLCNILRLLLDEGCAVAFFADNRAYVEGYSTALQQMGVEVLWHPYLSDPVTWFEQNGKRLDLVFVSRHYIASTYVDLVRRHAPKARLAFDTVDLHYLREQRAAELANSSELARTAEKTREKELALIHSSDVTLVVSPVEQTLLAREAPGARVEILSNVHEVFGRRREFSARKDIMFIGGYQHPPNVDAAIWFAKEILPLVHAELPDLVFHLIGSKAPAEVKNLGELAGIKFHGFVENIEPFLDGCRLAVAPLRYGAGVKGKVNMSMSYGQPVVATGIATEGMFAEAGRDVLVAETPQDFAAHVIRAYRDETLWLQLSDNGLANVRRYFSFESARTSLRRLLD